MLPLIFYHPVKDLICIIQHETTRVHAVTVISKWWRMIQAQRRLKRLRINSELECIPDIGIKYFEARNRFYNPI